MVEGDEMNGVYAPEEVASREGLGAALASLRRERGLTGEKLGALVEMSQGKISKLERGVLRASPDDVERILVALDRRQTIQADVVADLIDQSRRLRGSGAIRRLTSSSPGTANQQDYLDAEARAVRIRNFEPIAVPGLLQISEYTRRLVNAYHTVAVGDAKAHWSETAATVALRMRRQERLYDPSRRFEFVIMESVLGNRFASPGVMLAQVDRLEQAAALDNVTIRIVRSTTELGYAPVHGFNIFDDDVVITETFTATTSHDRQSIDFYAHFFATYFDLADANLSPILEKYKTLYADFARPKSDQGLTGADDVAGWEDGDG